jgi:hypothetical protein
MRDFDLERFSIDLTRASLPLGVAARIRTGRDGGTVHEGHPPLMRLDRAVAPGVVGKRFHPTLLRAQFLRDGFSRLGLAPSVAARFGRRFGRLYTHSDEILQRLVEVRIARNVECLPHVRQQSVRTPFPTHSSVPDPPFFGTLACVRGGRSRRRSLRRAVDHLWLIHVRLACSAWAFLGTGRGTSRYQADGPRIDLPATDIQPSRHIVISTTAAANGMVRAPGRSKGGRLRPSAPL